MVSISDTTSIITVAALIASIAVYYKQYKEMSKQNETLKRQIEEMKKQTDSLQEQVRIMKVKPKLDVEFEYSTIDKPVPINGVNPKFGEAKLIRIKVSNNGDTVAKECIAKAEIIRNSVPETFGGVLLHWIRYWEGVYTDIKDQFKPLDIAKGDYEIADLVVINKITQDILSLGFYIPKGKYSVIRCNRNPSLLPLDDRARVRARDIIRVNVYCDNITSKPICLKVLKDPDYDVINDNNVGDFFKEIECPKL
ncbi:hypothetical protein DDW10_00160 [Sulfolobales archaeon SCGC AB-777_J03]|nr:hypothetical protein DDW06_01880 [Sulfolobales archaeon SCGC AB-777_K20]PVU73674.1 hypothetical protein DDW10_00160 [Sulfolobales archaeon SCGC AB-777_J03]